MGRRVKMETLVWKSSTRMFPILVGEFQFQCRWWFKLILTRSSSSLSVREEEDFLLSGKARLRVRSLVSLINNDNYARCWTQGGERSPWQTPGVRRRATVGDLVGFQFPLISLWFLSDFHSPVFKKLSNTPGRHKGFQNLRVLTLLFFRFLFPCSTKPFDQL